MARISAEDRFFAKVDKSGTCWVWTGTFRRGGYGGFRDADGKVRSSHRLAYEFKHGPIPDGMDIDHTCHNPKCVRHDHLRIATRKQNLENLSGIRKNNTSGVRGVYWDPKNDKWIAQVRHNYSRVYVGRFAGLADAEAAVTAKRLELFTHNNADRTA